MFEDAFARFPMKKSGWLALIIGVWISAVGTGFASVWRHAETPGAAASTGPQWPAQSQLPRANGRATLVLFAHPQCPCTQASLHEMARILARDGDRVTCYVVFERLRGTPPNWTQTALRHEAESLVGVRVREDTEREAKLFDARTSGQTLLYDARGQLRFAGGLTESRGHEGDNTGEDVVLSVLRGERRSLAVAHTPVFGCAFR